MNDTQELVDWLRWAGEQQHDWFKRRGLRFAIGDSRLIEAAERIAELEAALKIGAVAIEIASDWNMPSVQCNPPAEWNLGGCGEDPADGWCCTYALAQKLGGIADAAMREGEK